MTTPTFGSPLGQFIHPKGWVRPAGNNEPVVTATFADHIADDRNPGVDVGTGRCGDQQYAMCTGIVSTAGLIGKPVPNALTLRIRDVNGYEPAVTHLGSLAVNPRTGAKWKVGDTINRGERTGTLGMSGATQCHCHIGMKHLVNGVWVEIDSWPLLAQNQETPMIPIPTAAFTRLNNMKATTIHSANFWAERLTSAAILRTFPIGTAFYPVFSANDGTPAGGPTPTLWFYGAMYDDSPAGYVGGWVHSSNLGPLEAAVPSAVLDSGPMVKEAVGKAVDALTTAYELRIAGIKRKVTDGATDIADD